ncbi:rhodanese-like domain-containing protein [Robertkochia flava]|uniref:rhodanese-like domain-containing protein n=1 Tax=Robertkochia flava TaxID=3447986 RepID=UPI001CC92D9C|nr:rhodanese-like domain-containing protein [Robertkochia marina]
MILDTLRELLFSPGSDQVKVLSPEDYKRRISNGNAVIIDVRTKREYLEGHIEGARNLDIFQTGKFQSQCELLNREQPVYIYCRSGNRSRRASKMLSRMGFKEIYDLKGGILNWY